MINLQIEGPKYISRPLGELEGGETFIHTGTVWIKMKYPNARDESMCLELESGNYFSIANGQLMVLVDIEGKVTKRKA